MYGPGGKPPRNTKNCCVYNSITIGSYHVFAGKDASKGLGLSSVKPEDAVPDYSGLDETAMKTLDGWYEFFQ
jgi:hypothetical protein